MKLIYKGICNNTEELPKSVLPSNAVKFKEPENMTMTMLTSALFAIPTLLGVLLFVVISYLLHGSLSFKLTLAGSITAALFSLPHEMLHAICFGKSAVVELYFAPKQLSLFVLSTQPVTKARFIILSLLPNIVFGWMPLFIWTLLPYSEVYSNHLFSFAFFSVLFGVGDYMNVFNAIRQMPRGSMQQLSGFTSYWFMP